MSLTRLKEIWVSRIQQTSSIDKLYSVWTKLYKVKFKIIKIPDARTTVGPTEKNVWESGGVPLQSFGSSGKDFRGTEVVPNYQRK